MNGFVQLWAEDVEKPWINGLLAFVTKALEFGTKISCSVGNVKGIRMKGYLDRGTERAPEIIY